MAHFFRVMTSWRFYRRLQALYKCADKSLGCAGAVYLAALKNYSRHNWQRGRSLCKINSHNNILMSFFVEAKEGMS